MNNEVLETFESNLKEKLGDENFGLIVDDIATLRVSNNTTLEDITKKDENINKLKQDNQALLQANANLLQKIPVTDTSKSGDSEEKEITKETFTIRDLIDTNGRFKNII